jgi:hypothetical protein
MSHIFAFAVNALLVEGAPSTLTFHAVFVFAPLKLLLILFLVGAGFVYIRHKEVVELNWV